MEQGLPASGAAEKPWNNSFQCALSCTAGPGKSLSLGQPLREQAAQRHTCDCKDKMAFGAAAAQAGIVPGTEDKVYC